VEQDGRGIRPVDVLGTGLAQGACRPLGGFVAPRVVLRVWLEPDERHRLVLTAEASVRGVDPADVVDDVLGRVDVPPTRG
jgi:hypothetical protein